MRRTWQETRREQSARELGRLIQIGGIYLVMIVLAAIALGAI